MYLPNHFKVTDGEKIAALVGTYPFATLVHTGPDGLAADHIPFFLDRNAGSHGILKGHVARGNPLWRHADGQPVLAVFKGPDAYVHPGWYPSKQKDGKVVPTWNYAAVHMSGILRAIQDGDELTAILEELTLRHEQSRPVPWKSSDAPAGYIEKMMRAIVGIEIEVTDIQGKWKVSQNKTGDDWNGIAQGLDGEGTEMASAVAALVRESGA